MKKKILKGIFYGLLLVILLVAGGLTYVKWGLPAVDAPDLKVEITPQRIQRGEYLSNHVTGCTGCHGGINRYVFPPHPMEGTLGKGGEKFDLGIGVYYAPNITPAAIGDWTDGELFRAITAGVNKKGKALFPIMPYELYGKMDKEDIYSIIAYIRTLKPIQQEVPESSSKFPMNFIINTIPKEATLGKLPEKKDELAYGKYLINAAVCAECHSPRDEQGEVLPGMDYAGGAEFEEPQGLVVRSANLTPDVETGIGNWTKEAFIKKFKSYENMAKEVKKGEFQTAMPWRMYAGMTEEDLGAIYTYLRTLKPVENKVEKFSWKTKAMGNEQ